MKIFGSQKGFTMLEMMVAIGISSMIAYSMFFAMRLGDDQIQTTQLKMYIQDSAREGVYRMIQELRQSSPTRITIGAGGNNIQFSMPNSANPVNPDFSVNWGAAHTIRYALGGLNNRQLIKTNMTTSQTTVFGNDVTGVTFTGNTGSPTIVTITMNVQRALINGRLVPAQPLQMTGQAEIRNT